jgi:ribosomal protein S27AE
VAADTPQRSYRAPCPGCGAPVEFASAQSTHAVCGYCQSTVVRNGETLARTGKMAELFDDHSPLQLQVSGVWTEGGRKQAFTLVGRLQYKYDEGTWNEWHAVLQDGSSAYLSEDNGAYVFTRPWQVQGTLISPASAFKVGTSTQLGGRAFSVASNQRVMLLSAQGELPRLPELGKLFDLVELRSQGPGGGGGIGSAIAPDQVLSIDYSTEPPSLSVGAAVLLEDLQLTGLKDGAAKDEKGRAFNCPQCGASVLPVLATTKSITCGSCHSIIDLNAGIGGELRHATQDEPIRPLIPLGAQGQLQGVVWQVVGFQHRIGQDPADPDEQFGWEEYLLYNRKRGFTFLVDATDGWSLLKPATGAPVMTPGGKSASYLGVRYQAKESYNAETNFVAGEFYWQVTRGQKTANREFQNGKNLLSMEHSPNELTWSVGSQIDSDAVAKAFKLEGKKDLLKRQDAGPASAASSSVGCFTAIVVVFLVLFFVLLLGRCSSNCDPNVENCSSSSSGGGARTSGGSFGGSSGGGHK